MPVKSFRFYGYFQGIELDGNFTKTFEAQAEVLVRKCARAFIREMILQVPIWTGFTRGAIKFAQGPNGDLATFLRVAVSIGPPRSRYPKFYYPEGGGRKIRKVPENAGRFGEYNFTNARHRYGFSFRLDVIQFLLNEFYAKGSPTAPWGSLKVGQKAFRAALKEGVKSLPKVQNYMKRKHTRIDIVRP